MCSTLSKPTATSCPVKFQTVLSRGAFVNDCVKFMSEYQSTVEMNQTKNRISIGFTARGDDGLAKGFGPNLAHTVSRCTLFLTQSTMC